MTSPSTSLHNHKTVLVLDHCSYFARHSQQTLDFDMSAKSSKQQSTTPGTQVTLHKTLWTGNVEAALEYHRIVRDLFPDARSKLVRFFVCDENMSQFVNLSWNEEEQSSLTLLSGLAKIGPPDPKADNASTVLSAVVVALEALNQASPEQSSRFGNGDGQQNCGRMIIFTHLQSNEAVKQLTKAVSVAIDRQNDAALQLNNPRSYQCIDSVELCIVNTFPQKGEIVTISPQPLHRVSSALSAEVLTCPSGRPLAYKIHHLVQRHYELASTTVTNIPMKEEQNSGSSANYDVELLHDSRALAELRRAGYLEKAAGMAKEKLGNYCSVSLRWVSPSSAKGLTAGLDLCTNAFRVTPADVNSRQSVCLANFISGGRTVLLEMGNPRLVSSEGGKHRPISHQLQCHAGYIYIHSTPGGIWPRHDTTFLDEIPGTADCPGGRVADYRMIDFQSLLREQFLFAPTPAERVKPKPSAIPRQRLYNVTRFFPLISSEFALNVPALRLETLLSTVRKAKMLGSEVEECRAVIYKLQAQQSASDKPLSVAHVLKLKGLSRAKQFAIVWNQLEQFVAQYLSVFNDGQRRELHKLICHAGQVDPTRREPWTLDRPPPLSGSSVQPPPAKKQRTNSTTATGGMTLLDLVNRRYAEQRMANWKDFDGRTEDIAMGGDGSRVELYPALMEKFRENERAEEVKPPA